MPRLPRLLPLLTVIALTACAPHSAPVNAPVQAAPISTVCTGVAGCSRVASVDVDGDGRADQVGVASKNRQNGGSITVRVRTANGLATQTTGRHVRWFGKAYFGAAQLDGEKGAEIFVGDTMGAHYEQFRVVTFRAGKLVTLQAPPLVWSKQGMRPSTSRWGVDGSWAFNTGVSRRVSAKNVVTVTMTSLERNESGRGHTGQATTYRWQHGQWVHVSSRTLHTSNKAAYAAGGWHVRGLRHFV